VEIGGATFLEEGLMRFEGTLDSLQTAVRWQISICNSRCILGIILTWRASIYFLSVPTFPPACPVCVLQFQVLISPHIPEWLFPANPPREWPCTCWRGRGKRGREKMMARSQRGSRLWPCCILLDWLRYRWRNWDPVLSCDVFLPADCSRLENVSSGENALLFDCQAVTP